LSDIFTQRGLQVPTIKEERSLLICFKNNFLHCSVIRHFSV